MYSKYNIDEIYINEDFINVKFNNNFNINEPELINKPIINEEGRKIGYITDADEEYVYGIVFSAYNIFEDKKETFFFEVIGE